MKDVLMKQKELFKSGETYNYKYRLIALTRIKMLLELNEKAILDALKKDLNKSEQESYMSELGLVYDEIRLQKKLVKRYAKKSRVRTPLMLSFSKSYVQYQPYGSTLIIGPFNYPLQLVLIPMIGAIAAGNTVIVKASEKTPTLSNLLMNIFNDNFDSEYIYFCKPNLTSFELNELMGYKYDLIFFTGSYNVGQKVLEKASHNLTPTILELGGKSPVIVDESAKIEMSAKRIVWGKLMNAGQTCIAPDYIYVQENIKDKLVAALINEIDKQYSKEDSVKIIDDNAMNRLVSYLDNQEVIHGGTFDIDRKEFNPTIIDNPSLNSDVMLNEIFGPILPILTFNNVQDVVSRINEGQRPLVTYYFGCNKVICDKLNVEISSGALIQNDTLIHASNNNLPFGGVGASGMFAYHGKYSYYAFSHLKPIVKRSINSEFSMRYMPYSKNKINIIRKLLK
ncbi:MAG: aldehyde dehydrogenase family protein [Erysipelotrichales bacterium]